VSETYSEQDVNPLPALRAVPPPVDAGAGQPSFDELYAELFPFVWRCLRALGVSPAFLDDAAQDVFVVVHRQLRGFAGNSSPRTWLYGIARRVAFNHRRRLQRKGRTEPLEPEREPPSLDRDPHQVAEDGQAALFLQGFLASLRENRREVFLLAVIEQWSAPEVAEALAIPLNTVYSRLRAARLEFQEALALRQEKS
jgi:RNA polymerase sigma-70 factor, ECF subfamily